MCTHGLPDIYSRSLRATGPQALGVYIRQTTRAHGITIKYCIIVAMAAIYHITVKQLNDQNCSVIIIRMWLLLNYKTLNYHIKD